MYEQSKLQSVAFKQKEPSLVANYRNQYVEAMGLGHNDWSAICIALIILNLKNPSLQFLTQLIQRTRSLSQSFSFKEKETLSKFSRLLDEVSQLTLKQSKGFVNAMKKEKGFYEGSGQLLQYFVQQKYKLDNTSASEWSKEWLEKLTESFKFSIVIDDKRKVSIQNMPKSNDLEIVLFKSEKEWYFLRKKLGNKQNEATVQTILQSQNGTCSQCKKSFQKQYMFKNTCQHWSCADCVMNWVDPKVSKFWCRVSQCNEYIDIAAAKRYFDSSFPKTQQNPLEEEKLCSECMKYFRQSTMFRSNCPHFYCQICVTLFQSDRFPRRCKSCQTQIEKKSFYPLQQKPADNLINGTCQACPQLANLIVLDCKHRFCQNCLKKKEYCPFLQCQEPINYKKIKAETIQKTQFVPEPTNNAMLVQDSVKAKCSSCKKSYHYLELSKNNLCNHFYCKVCIKEQKISFCRIDNCLQDFGLNISEQGLTKQDQAKFNLKQNIAQEIDSYQRCEFCFRKFKIDDLYINECGHGYCQVCLKVNFSNTNLIKCPFKDSSRVCKQILEKQHIFKQIFENQNGQIKISCHLCLNQYDQDYVFINGPCSHRYCFRCIGKNGIPRISKECYQCTKRVNILELEKFYYECVSKNLNESSSEDKLIAVSLQCSFCQTQNEIQYQQKQEIEFFKCKKCEEVTCYQHKDQIQRCFCFCTRCLRRLDENTFKNIKLCQKCYFVKCFPCGYQKYCVHLVEFTKLADAHDCQGNKKLEQVKDIIQQENQFSYQNSADSKEKFQKSSSSIYNKSLEADAQNNNSLDSNNQADSSKTNKPTALVKSSKNIEPSNKNSISDIYNKALGNGGLDIDKVKDNVPNTTKSKICLQSCKEICSCQGEYCSVCLCLLDTFKQSDKANNKCSEHNVCLNCSMSNQDYCLFCSGKLEKAQNKQFLVTQKTTNFNVIQVEDDRKHQAMLLKYYQQEKQKRGNSLDTKKQVQNKQTNQDLLRQTIQSPTSKNLEYNDLKHFGTPQIRTQMKQYNK